MTQLGRLAHLAGDHPAAKAHYDEAPALHRLIGDRMQLSILLERYALLARTQGRSARAVRIFGAARARMAAMSVPLQPWLPGTYDMDLPDLRAALGDAAFEATLAEGLGLSLDRALDAAAGDSDDRV